MKKYLVVVLLGSSFLSASQRKTEKSSISHLFVRPVYDNLTTRNNYWHDSFFDTEKNNAYQILFQYNQSFNSKKMRRHFLMADQNELKVRGSAHGSFSSVSDPTDVRAEWIGLPDDFEGTLKIRPTLWQASFMFTARHSFEKLFDSSFFDGWFGFASVPVVLSHTNMHFEQESVTGALTSGDVRDILTAFNNPAWNYQKIRTAAQQPKFKAGDVRIGIGRTLLSNGRATAATYSAVSMPTTKTQKNKYMFEPQTGYNGHIGIVLGADLQLPLSREDSLSQVALFLDFENNSLIRNKQYRTFDLKNKEWSRFLQYRKVGLAAEQGVNVMTRKTRCSPYNITQASSGIRFMQGKIEGQIGAGVWGHGSERLVLDKDWEEVYGIAGSTTTTTASNSTISARLNNAATPVDGNDTTFITVKKNDIDLASAASPSTVTFNAHASLGGRGRGTNADGFWGIGGFIEIPRNETKAFKIWGFWATVGGAF